MSSIGNDMRPAIRGLIERVLGRKAQTSAELRTTVFSFAASLRGERGDVPAALLPWLEKVARSPYRVTDSDVEALRRAGFDDAAIFEITIAAATGAAAGRYRKGLDALEEAVR